MLYWTCCALFFVQSWCVLGWNCGIDVRSCGAYCSVMLRAILLVFFCNLFWKGEGFELMLRCLREKKHAAWCAVKVLDFALTDNDVNCQRCERKLYCISLVSFAAELQAQPGFLFATSAPPRDFDQHLVLVYPGWNWLALKMCPSFKH